MKMIVVTTITSTLDVETMEPTHSVDIEDQDGLSDVSREVLGALILGALHATERGIREQFSRVARVDDMDDMDDMDDEKEN